MAFPFGRTCTAAVGVFVGHLVLVARRVGVVVGLSAAVFWVWTVGVLVAVWVADGAVDVTKLRDCDPEGTSFPGDGKALQASESNTKTTIARPRFLHTGQRLVLTISSTHFLFFCTEHSRCCQIVCEMCDTPPRKNKMLSPGADAALVSACPQSGQIPCGVCNGTRSKRRAKTGMMAAILYRLTSAFYKHSIKCPDCQSDILIVMITKLQVCLPLLLML